MPRYAHRFQPGDTVDVVVPHRVVTDESYHPALPLSPAVVTRQLASAGYCVTCHCEPKDPDHAGDGSLCCPGPFYTVAADGREYGFAEHEMEPHHPAHIA